MTVEELESVKDDVENLIRQSKRLERVESFATIDNAESVLVSFVADAKKFEFKTTFGNMRQLLPELKQRLEARITALEEKLKTI